MGVMSRKVSASPASRNAENESRWMATRSGRARTSSRLAKEKRSRTVDREAKASPQAVVTVVAVGAGARALTRKTCGDEARRARQRVSVRPKGRAIKPALLDQTCVAGLGNIYADEALHRARIHPLTRAGDLEPEEVVRLHQGILDVLAVAVPVAGAVVKNGRAFDDGRGADGGARHEVFPHVDGRLDEPVVLGEEGLARTIAWYRNRELEPQLGKPVSGRDLR